MLLCFIHVVTCISNYFLLIVEYYFIKQNSFLFIHSAVHGHLGHFKYIGCYEQCCHKHSWEVTIWICCHSVMSNSVTLWTVACQAPLLEWVDIFYSGNLPHPGIEPVSLIPPALAGGFFTTAPQFYSILDLQIYHKYAIYSFNYLKVLLNE